VGCREKGLNPAPLAASLSARKGHHTGVPWLEQNVGKKTLHQKGREGRKPGGEKKTNLPKRRTVSTWGGKGTAAPCTAAL